MSVIEEIEEFIKSMPVGYEFSRKWFKTELSRQYNRSAESYIPSDYCYNRKNKGINYDKQPHYFCIWGAVSISMLAKIMFLLARSKKSQE